MGWMKIDEPMVVLPLSQSHPCTQCQRATRYGLVEGLNMIKPRCQEHIPAGMVREMWITRFLDVMKSQDEQQLRRLVAYMISIYEEEL